MKFRYLYVWKTKVGSFYIAQSEDGRFHPVFQDESLGSYHKDWQAAEDLAGGHTFSCRGVSDTSALGISPNIRDWERVM